MGVYPSVERTFQRRGDVAAFLSLGERLVLKRWLRPGQGVSPFPSSCILGGVSIATSFLYLVPIIQQSDPLYIKNTY